MEARPTNPNFSNCQSTDNSIANTVKMSPDFVQILDAINIENQKYDSLVTSLGVISERIKRIKPSQEGEDGHSSSLNNQESLGMVDHFVVQLSTYRRSNSNLSHLINHLEGIFGTH